MEGEFNNLEFDNTKVTFTGSTNNIATSDELEASLMYQDKMGTVYSKSKTASKVLATAGIVILATAASIKSGTLISNAFILNPPSLSETSFEVEEGIFSFSFTVSNSNNYQIYYYIDVDGVNVVKEDCSSSSTYNGTFDDINDDQSGKFYVQFSNNFDYKKNLITVNFNTGGILS